MPIFFVLIVFGLDSNFSNYKARFTMPGGDNMFFSFDLGPVHFLSISTEFYYFMNYGMKMVAKQYQWIVEDLKVCCFCKGNMCYRLKDTWSWHTPVISWTRLTAEENETGFIAQLVRTNIYVRRVILHDFMPFFSSSTKKTIHSLSFRSCTLFSECQEPAGFFRNGVTTAHSDSIERYDPASITVTLFAESKFA